MASLDGVRAKLARADRHRNVAHKLIRRFVRHECGSAPQFNADTNLFDVVAKLPQPPDEISLLIGDCVHNMRSALDHLVHELVLANPNRPTGTPNEKTMFPICDTDNGYRRQVDKLHRILGVPDVAAAEIKALQPYLRRDRGLNHQLYPLWVLNKLENIDKHRRLALTSAVAFQTFTAISYGQRDPEDDEPDTIILRAGESIHDGTVLTSYPPPTNEQETVQVDGCLLACVALNEPAELPDLMDVDVASILRQLLQQIRFAVLPRFERLIR